MIARSRRGSFGALAAAITLLLGPLLALGTTGCEAILGTGDLHDQVGGAEAGPGDDDDDDDDDDAAVHPDAGKDAAPELDGTTLNEGGPLDAGDAGDATHGGDAGEGGIGDAGDAGPPSCAIAANASAKSCGLNGTDDCCATGFVPADTYYRSFQQGENLDYPVSVSSFNLDSYEVTVGRMRAYAAWLASAAGGAPASGSGVHTHVNGGQGLLVEPSGFYESGWSSAYNNELTEGTSANAAFADSSSCETTYTATANGAESRPMNCVSWYDAYAFCIWDGGFLPTEAEWELAAVGGSSQYQYPWGNSPAPQPFYAVFDCTESSSCPQAVGTAFDGVTSTNQFDMLGNVAEWTLDDYSATAYSDTEDCQDCVELYTGSGTKVDRGGAFDDTTTDGYLSTQDRADIQTNVRSAIAGFRCARVPK